MNHETADIHLLAERAKEHLPRGGVILLRHGPREEIAQASVAAAVAASLTDEGRAVARALGAALTPARPLRLFHSPVPRCIDTAVSLAEGFRGAGGAAEILGVRPFLAASFVRDEHALIAAIAERGLQGFMKAWVHDELDDGVVQPISDAARELLLGLSSARTHDDDGLDIHVSHDIVLLALLSLAWDIGREGFPWPGFLEGVTLRFAEDAGSVELWFRDLGTVLPFCFK